MSQNNIIHDNVTVVQVKATESPGTMRMSLGTSLAASQRGGTAPVTPTGGSPSVKGTMEKSGKSVTRPMGATLPVCLT